jgi:hypothetical protein
VGVLRVRCCGILWELGGFVGLVGAVRGCR